MTWFPADYDGSCSDSLSNHSVALTLTCFLVQFFGKSHDEILTQIYDNSHVNETDFDFIVVGAGSAGCVVANRLSEELQWRVLLLEAGDEEPLIAEIPRLATSLWGTNIDYAYRTNDSKSEVYRRGKVMGGSSTINGLVYARGSQVDYDDWAASGNRGWSWRDVLPYFMKSENARDPEILANYSQYHGTGGYLTVEQLPTEDENTLTLMKAFKEIGLRGTDYNKGDQIGVARMQFTNAHGTRLSSNGAFIRPIRGIRPNLVIKPNTRAIRIIIDPKTKRAIGVEYELIHKNGALVKQVFAKKEVIVSAGFIESPKLLMLSGIGPRKNLQNLKIPVIQDLPVGLNFRDHYMVSVKLISLNKESPVVSDEKMKSNLFEWLNTHEGPLSARGSVNVEAFYQTKFEKRPGAADIQYELSGGTVGKALGNITIFTILVAPKSNSGFVRLNSFDPVNTQPDIYVNAATDARDLETLVEGVKFARRFARTKTLNTTGLKLSTVRTPGCENFDFESDNYIRCFIKNTVAHNAHGVGTCKMGPKADGSSVVDPELKVHGISGLRVIDASIMPQIIRANTHAPTVMIGEKGSDLIKKDWL